jgi:hypothetical protein
MLSYFGMSCKLVSSGNDVTGDCKSTLKLENLSVNLVGLNDGIFDSVKHGSDVNTVKCAGNLKFKITCDFKLPKY